MNIKELKKILAGVGIAGLLAGGGVAVTGGTALGVLSLSVKYHYLPIYQR